MKPHKFFSALRKAMDKPVYEVDTRHRPCLRVVAEDTDRLFSPTTLVYYEATGIYHSVDQQSEAAKGLGLEPGFEKDISISSDSREGVFREPLVAAVLRDDFRHRGQYIGVAVLPSHRVATSYLYRGPKLIEETVDKEAESIIEKAKAYEKDIAVEDLKTESAPLLRRFQERLKQLAEASGITVCEIDPEETCITCEACGFSDEKNRNGTAFYCPRCKHDVHTDLIAARNISRKAVNAFPFHQPRRKAKVSAEPRKLSKAMKAYEFFSVLRQALAQPVYTMATDCSPSLRIREEGTGRLFSPATLVLFRIQGTYLPHDSEGNILTRLGMLSDLEWEIIYSSGRFPDGKLREPLVSLVSKEGFGQMGPYIGAKVGISHSVTYSNGYLGEKLSKTNPDKVFDREAARLVDVAGSCGKGIAIESSEELFRLQGTWSAPYKLHRFGEILKKLAEAEGITVHEISFNQRLSRICELCGMRVAKAKFTKEYHCKYCGHETHLNLMAARNIARQAISAFPFHTKD